AAFSAYNFEWEPQLRASLALSLQPSGPGSGDERPALRRGRAIMWIEDALLPVRERHPSADVDRLVIAIRSATGIESLIWLIDIAGYSRPQAAETVRRTAQALLADALGPTPG